MTTTERRPPSLVWQNFSTIPNDIFVPIFTATGMNNTCLFPTYSFLLVQLHWTQTAAEILDVVRQIHSGIRLGTKRWVMDRLGLLNFCDYWFKTSAVKPTLINHYVVLNYLIHLQLVTVWQPFCKRSCDVNYRKIKCKQLYFFQFTSKHFRF